MIYPGPARVVLAAAAQLREPALIERYSEEWLASLRHRTHCQQWRDAISLLLRGAHATRRAYDGTNDSRSRLAVASQLTMAFVMAAGTVLLFTITSWVPRWTADTVSARTVHLTVWQRTPLWYDDQSILYMSLTAASTIGLVLLTRSSWRTVLGWVAIGIFAIILVNGYIYTQGTIWYTNDHASMDYVWYLEEAKEFQPVHGSAYGSFGSWWAAIASCANWWALYAALTLFVHGNLSPVIRVLAATQMVAIVRFILPDWTYHHAATLGLADLIRLIPGLLSLPAFNKFTAVEIASGIGFLLAILIVVIAWRCVMIAKSLIWPARRDSSGARICLR